MEAYMSVKSIIWWYICPQLYVWPQSTNSSPQASPIFPHVDLLEIMFGKVNTDQLTSSPLVFQGFHQKDPVIPQVSDPGISRRQRCCRHGRFPASVTLNERKNKTQNLNSALKTVSVYSKMKAPSWSRQGEQQRRSTIGFPSFFQTMFSSLFLLHCCVAQPYPHSSP